MVAVKSPLAKWQDDNNKTEMGILKGRKLGKYRGKMARKCSPTFSLNW